MKHLLSLFAKDKGGATAIEYALISAFVALVIITAITTVGLTLSDTFNGVAAVF